MHVEIWSDIACPWCYVGKRRFEKALAEYEQRDEVTVEWRSFELDPASPAERPQDGTTHLAEKYGMSREQALEMQRGMAQTAAAEGLRFDFDRQRGGNTFDAHRLLHLAKAHGLQDALGERLFDSYMRQGGLMSDHDTLHRLAFEAGLPEDEVVDTLASERFADDVREDERTARSFGISGVPFFVVDRQYGASGAQPPELLLQLLRQARPEIQLVAEGHACGIDGC